MPLEGLVGSEHDIRAVEVVQDPQHPVAVVELEMVEVMSFWGREEWKVIARVGVEGVCCTQAEPKPGRGDVGTQE